MQSAVPVAEELISRGHQVTFYLTEEFASAVRGIGAGFRALDPETGRRYQELSSGNPLRSLADAGKVLERMGPLMADLLVSGLGTVPSLAGQVRQENADIVVYNAMCPWGIALARMLAVPAATFSTTFIMKPGSGFERMFTAAPDAGKLDGTWDWVRRRTAELHERDGVPLVQLSDMFAPEEPVNLVPLIREFQPEAASLDERYVFTGPSVRAQPDLRGFPADRLGRDGPVLYISLGTAISRGAGAGFARVCFAAFNQTRWQVVLSGVTGATARELGGPPANFLVREHVPQLAVLERAAAFVTHGGVNSVMEAVWFGVPMVALPHTLEQLVFAGRVAELGAGVQLEPGTVTSSRLRDAVEEVTADVRYRARLAVLSRAAKGSGGYRKAADAIERAAGLPPPRPRR